MKTDFCLNKELTRKGAQHLRGAWCSAADTWRNLAAIPVASRWWGSDPCLSRSPQQRAPHVYVGAPWRSAIEAHSEWEEKRKTEREREKQRETEAAAQGEENNTGCEFESELSVEDRRGGAAHWEPGGTKGMLMHMTRTQSEHQR